MGRHRAQAAGRLDARKRADLAYGHLKPKGDVMAYEIVFTKRSTRTSITGQHGQEGPFEETHEEMPAMIERFKKLAADDAIAILIVRGPGGVVMSDVELYRLTGATGR